MVPTIVWALDHDNLDPNRPIAIEDAYVVPKGEIGVEGGLLYSDRKQGKSRFVFQPQLIIGAFDNTQLELSSDVSTDPRSVALWTSYHNLFHPYNSNYSMDAFICFYIILQIYIWAIAN